MRVEGELSDERPAPSGVPQGSCIAADLFICYIDSIAKLDFSTGTKLYLYADDACLVKPLSSIKDERDFQDDTYKVFEQACKQRLELNSDKTKIHAIFTV